MLVRFEFIDDDGVVLHAAISDVETEEDFVATEEIFKEKFGYNENNYNPETQNFYNRCIKSDVNELRDFNPVSLMCRKMGF